MKLNNIKVLSDADIALVHEASLDVLRNTGIMTFSRKALELLEKNGAEVDYNSKIAKIPSGLVEKAIKSTPHKFELYDRDNRKALIIGDGIPKCASGHNAIYIISSETSERRPSTVKDVEDFALISDYLEDIDIVGVPLMPQDIPLPLSSLLYAVKALYQNTSKPIFFSTENSSVNACIIKMMKAIAGKQDISLCPNAIAQLSPTSPLFWEEGAIEALMDVAEEGVPLVILPEPMAGVSSPYSVAGLLTVHNIEALSGIVISQLVRPGTPVVYGSSWTTYDMKHTTAIIGSPETNILRIAGSQMARHYNIPSHTTAPNSDSNLHDEQNAWEKALSNFCSICSGNDIIMNSGMFATGLTVSLEQLIIDDEINGIIRRIYKGIDVNPDSIDVNSIKTVGHRGNYFMEELTINNLRSGEFRETKVSNVKFYDTWVKEGSCSIVDNANRKMHEYLSKGPRNPLDANRSRALDEIINSFIENYN